MRLNRLVNLAWIFFEKFGVLVVSAVTFFCFAVYLEPSELGLGVMALAIVESFGVFYSMMLEDPLVREKKLTTTLASSVFWLGILLAVVTMSLLTFCMWIFSGDSILWALIGVASFKTIAIIGARPFIANCRRQRNFKALASRTLVSKLLGAGVGIFSASHGAGAWTVILQHLVIDYSAFCVLFWKDRKLIRLNVDTGLFLYIARQGLPAAIKTSCNSLISRGAIIILGITTSPMIVGYFSFASRLVDLPLLAISNGLTSYSVPAFATRLNQNNTNISDFFLGSSVITSLIFLPFFVVGGITFSHFLVPIFGEKWQPVTEFFGIVSIVGGLKLLTLYVPGLLVVFGKAKVGMYLEITNTILSLTILYVLSYLYGLDGALVALIFFRFFSTLIKMKCVGLVLRGCEKKFNEYIFTVFLCAFVAGFVSWLALNYVDLSMVNLIIIGLSALALQFTLVFITNSRVAYFIRMILYK